MQSYQQVLSENLKVIVPRFIQKINDCLFLAELKLDDAYLNAFDRFFK